MEVVKTISFLVNRKYSRITYGFLSLGCSFLECPMKILYSCYPLCIFVSINNKHNAVAVSIFSSHPMFVPWQLVDLE